MVYANDVKLRYFQRTILKGGKVAKDRNRAKRR